MIEKKAYWSGNMFKQVNQKGEKVNIILNGVREIHEDMEQCPVEIYITLRKIRGLPIDYEKAECI